MPSVSLCPHLLLATGILFLLSPLSGNIPYSTSALICLEALTVSTNYAWLAGALQQNHWQVEDQWVEEPLSHESTPPTFCCKPT